MNKNYYDVLSHQNKSIGTVFQQRHDAYRTNHLKRTRAKQALPDDLDSLFFPQAAVFDKDVLNELITEHMVLDDPNNLTEVIRKFQVETGC